MSAAAAKAGAPKPRRSRLLDGLVVAAVGLLALKGAALLLGNRTEPVGPDGLPPFARVLAHARSNYSPPDPTTTGSVGGHAPAPAPAAAPPPPEPAAAEPPAAAESPSEAILRERLGERSEELRGKSRDLDTREKLIEELERRLDARSAEQKAAEERDRAATTNAAAQEAAGLRNIVVMYETMKPKEAARVFERLPQDVLVSLVRALNPRKMAEILAAMSPDSAEKLTIALARRDKPADTDKSGGALPPGELPALDLPARPAPAATPGRPRSAPARSGG